MKVQIEGLEPGDILLSKSFSLLGWAIGSCFRVDSPLQWYDSTWGLDAKMRPSNHNGIFGYDEKAEPVIFESLGSGFQATPIDEYARAVLEGECELKFARLPDGLTDVEEIACRQWCLNHLGAKYDFRSYLSHFWRILLRLPPIWNSSQETKFYCTEAVARCYRDIGNDILGDNLPCPYTAEKRIKEGKLLIVDEWWRK